MENYIIIAVVALIIGLAAFYVIRAKKNGKKCIGCPGGCCSNNGDCSQCSCRCTEFPEE